MIYIVSKLKKVIVLQVLVADHDFFDPLLSENC
jgi:hypothetical protein